MTLLNTERTDWERVRHARWRAVAEAWQLPSPPPVPDADFRPLVWDAADPSRPGASGRTWQELADPHDALVGVGEAGLAFTATKGVARWAEASLRHGHLLVDAIHGEVVLDGVRLDHDPVRLRRLLLGDGVLQLSIVAHGDGGHLKLPGLVGCGVTLDGERFLKDGRSVLGGCVPGVRCVRAPGDYRKVVLCSDIRVAQVFLLVCKAGLLTDARRPTNANAALAFLDGWALGVVAPAGNCRVSSVTAKGLLQLSDPGSADRVRPYLDDLCGDGDPLFRILGHPQELPVRPESPPPPEVAVRRVAPGPGRRLAWRRDGNQALRPGHNAAFGGTYLVLPATASASCVAVAPARSPFGSHAAEWRRQLDLMRLHTVQLVHALGGTEAVNDPARSLSEARTRAEQEVYALIERHSAALEHGMAAATSGTTGPIRKALAGWEEAAADACVILAGSCDPFAVLGANLMPQAPAPLYISCTACGGVLTRVVLADPLTSLRWTRDDCRRCGPRALLSQHARAGFSVVDNGGWLRLDTNTPGIAVVAVSDKESGVTTTARAVVVDPTCRLDVPCGSGTGTPRTLRVVLIAGGAISTWKDRM